MAGKEEKSRDFYAVLGLKKECSTSELRNAYKKLALKWHPDRCSASGNSKHVEESKKKFQAIQEAYSGKCDSTPSCLTDTSIDSAPRLSFLSKIPESQQETALITSRPRLCTFLLQLSFTVLSDADKRFLYDVGVYDSDDDDENDMGDFLGEMAAMMSQSKPNSNETPSISTVWIDSQTPLSTVNGEESLEQLQELFDEMFQRDRDNFGSTSYDGTSNFGSTNNDGGNSSGSLKRNSADMSSGRAEASSGFSAFEGGGGFCFGRESTEAQAKDGRGGSKRRSSGGRKQKASSRQDVSSQGAGISA
ncbi:hypothetical protein ACLOJK_000958 [Asimina triloba]